MTRTAIITVGIPASGKSTFAAHMVAAGVVDVDINLDDCRAAICGDAANQAATQQAVSLHTAKVDQAIANGDSMVISDTNLNPMFLLPLVQKLKASGFQVNGVVFNTSFDTCVSRNQNRDRVVDHNVMVRLQGFFNDFVANHIDNIGFDQVVFKQG